MAKFFKLTAHVTQAVGKDDLKAILVNMDHVLKVTPAEEGKGAKLTYASGQTERVLESRDLIERLLAGEDVGSYKEPGEPIPQDA